VERKPAWIIGQDIMPKVSWLDGKGIQVTLGVYGYQQMSNVIYRLRIMTMDGAMVATAEEMENQDFMVLFVSTAK